MPSSTPKKKTKSRSNTPSTSSSKPKTKSRSQTPSYHHKQKNQNQNQSKQDNPNQEQTPPLSPNTQQAFLDALEDVHTRFILNLPEEELASSDRIFFQIEQAWWFYEDFVCDEMDEETTPNEQKEECKLPRFKKLQPFARKIFEISPILSPLLSNFQEYWGEFSRYRRKISTYGTILLNEDFSKILLCQDYHGKSWTLPAGKVNQNEKGTDAAARETYEETGFDPNCNLGPTKDYTDANDVTWNALTEEHSLVYSENDGAGKRRTCYICHGVPEDFDYAPVVRKEILDVQWHTLDNIPKKSFAVMPFMKGLKKWIRKNKKKNNKKKNDSRKRGRTQTPRSGSKGRNSNQRERSKSNQSTQLSEDDDLVQSGLGGVGDTNRWTEEEMFCANEKLIGRKVDYDGNPQAFATKGFDGIDPHTFRVVGGAFMNSGGNNTIAKAPDRNQLQPLYRRNDDDNDDDERSASASGNDLQPFFSDDGAAPWQTTVNTSPPSKGGGYSSENSVSGSSIPSASDFEAQLLHEKTPTQSKTHRQPIIQQKQSSGKNNNSSGLTILNMLRGGTKKESKVENTIPAAVSVPGVSKSAGSNNLDDIDIMTDKEITKKSQKEKKESMVKQQNNTTMNKKQQNNTMANKKQQNSTITNMKQQYEQQTHHDNAQDYVEDDEKGEENDDDERVKIIKVDSEHFIYLQNWVKKLPQSVPTKRFGDFRFDTDMIMKAVMETK